MAILRGEVYFIELGPTKGRELNSKRRPVVVLSVDAINRNPLVVVVIPGSSLKASTQRVHWNEVAVQPSEENGLTATTVFQCHQMKAVDHGRFTQEPAGVLAAGDLAALERTVKQCLGLL
jgi:mRNA interferase MazF